MSIKCIYIYIYTYYMYIYILYVYIYTICIYISIYIYSLQITSLDYNLENFKNLEKSNTSDFQYTQTANNIQAYFEIYSDMIFYSD